MYCNNRNLEVLYLGSPWPAFQKNFFGVVSDQYKHILNFIGNSKFLGLNTSLVSNGIDGAVEDIGVATVPSRLP